MIKINTNKKIGLCFSGGGARGAYQIGAAKALSELGIYQKISAFSGTSIGSANMALMVSTSIDKARDVWFNIPDNPLKSSEPIIQRLKNEKLKTLENGIYSMETLNKIMLEVMDSKVLKSKDVFVTVSESGDKNKGTFELIKSTFKHYVRKDSKALYVPLKNLTKEEQITAVTASCSIPFVFPAVTDENTKYYDGGVFDNTPIRPLIEAGCNEIIVVKISFLQLDFLQSEKFSNVKIHEIKRRRKMGGILDFSSKHSRELYEYGYRDTLEYFKNLEYSL